MTKLFLLPLILVALWSLFLRANGIPLAQGKKGYFYIIGISAVIIVALGLLLWITAGQNNLPVR